MDTSAFEDLLNKIRPRIEKRDTSFREAIQAGERLAIELRYLATGDSEMSLQYAFYVAHNTISGILLDVCKAIYYALVDEVEKEIYGGERGGIQTAKQAQCSHSRKEEAIVARRLEGSEKILKTTSIKKVNSGGSGDWCHTLVREFLGASSWNWASTLPAWLPVAASTQLAGVDICSGSSGLKGFCRIYLLK
ncbi:hypothetical protein V5799_006763 [Amblyomma americanum]|uniref:Uncharacterized protein n=1 Tax=Amblyomma americanum TaxID=6943 RepID=A0AAQ4DVG5_AMBAM